MRLDLLAVVWLASCGGNSEDRVPVDTDPPTTTPSGTTPTGTTPTGVGRHRFGDHRHRGGGHGSGASRRLIHRAAVRKRICRPIRQWCSTVAQNGEEGLGIAAAGESNASFSEGVLQLLCVGERSPSVVPSQGNQPSAFARLASASVPMSMRT